MINTKTISTTFDSFDCIRPKDELIKEHNESVERELALKTDKPEQITLVTIYFANIKEKPDE